MKKWFRQQLNSKLFRKVFFTTLIASVVPLAVMVIPTLALWLSEPLVPVIDKVKDPVEAEDDALTLSVEDAVEPDGGVTGPGRPIVIPPGADPTHE